MARTFGWMGLVMVSLVGLSACLQEPPADYTVPPDGSAPADASTARDAAVLRRDAGLDAASRDEDD